MASITIPSDPKLLAPALYDALCYVLTEAGRHPPLWEELGHVQMQPWLKAAENLFNNFVARSDGREPARVDWEIADQDYRSRHSKSHRFAPLGIADLSERSKQRQRKLQRELAAHGKGSLSGA